LPSPPIDLPADFHASTLKQGKEEDYIDVMRQSLKEKADLFFFRQNFSKYADYAPENMILIYHEKRPVAAAAAWQAKRETKRIGLLKDVGVAKDFQGRGLGRLVSLLALHRLKERGFQEVMLKTHSYRLRAIQLYLSLGFEPRYNFWAGKRKWKRLLRRIEQQRADRTSKTG
jgi:ribosomal protein S18 acetylase RimI-like enzyme